jgi:hypothetical protein
MYVVPLFAPNDIWITQHVTGVGGSKVGRLSESALQRPRGPGLFSCVYLCRPSGQTSTTLSACYFGLPGLNLPSLS